MVGEGARVAVRSQAIEVARGWSPPGAPASWELTAGMFSVLAEDDDLLAIAAEIPADRLPALLFCAAVCRLVAEGGSASLVRYFPPGGDVQPRLDAGFGPAMRAFCLEHRSELLALCRHRRYQMNEVARSIQVVLALGVVARSYPGARIALVDVGTGAGLGLHLDHYGYRLGHERRFGDQESPLQLHGEVEGGLVPPVPDPVAPIATRVGIDIDPVDLADADARRWVRACIPPEVESLARFDRAADIAVDRASALGRGDAVEVLPGVLDRIPADHLPVVADTYTAVFFSDEQHASFRELLAVRGRARDLAWISLDPLIPLGTAGRDSVQGLDVPAGLVREYQQGGVFALLGMVSYRDGARRGRLLARAHPSGTRFAWLDRATASR